MKSLGVDSPAMLTAGVGEQFQHIIQHLIQRQSQAAAVVITMDTGMDTSLRDRLVRMLIPSYQPCRRV